MPKISGDSLDEHRNQVHQRVFAALAELMTERSFDAISMAQIAARADIGRTAIYHHFPDKDAVVVAFASHETTQYIERLEAVLADAPEPVEALRLYVHHNLAAGEQFHVGLGASLYGMLAPESRMAIREHVVAIEDVLRGILRSGVESGDFRIGDEAAVMSLIHACLAPRTLPADSIETFILRGVGVSI